MSGQLDSNQLAVGLLLSALTIFVSNYSKVVRKPKIFTGNVLENKIVENCPSLNSIYWPSPWCWNAHLQFVPFVIRGLVDRYLYPPFSWISEEIQLVDGEFVILDWIARAPHVTDGLVASKKDTTPIVMIHHGAMCDSRDLPGQGYIQQALDRGWIVCALNRRGHAKNLTMGKWNFFGDVNDVHQVVKSIKQRRPKAILFTIGISSGSGLVARHFGEGDLNEFDAGVGICPGYDISKCLSRFSSPYKDLLLSRGKDFFLKRNEEHLREIPGYQEALKTDCLQEWLNFCHAMTGCSSLDEYYQKYNPMNFITKINKPCLFINAEDDPICVYENVEESLPLCQNSPFAILVTTKTGSHCPFYEGISMTCWAERATYEFFDAVLQD